MTLKSRIWQWKCDHSYGTFWNEKPLSIIEAKSRLREIENFKRLPKNTILTPKNDGYLDYPPIYRRGKNSIYLKPGQSNP